MPIHGKTDERHTKEGALKHYIADAEEQYIKLYPCDWFKRLLKFHVNDFDRGGKTAKINKRQKYLGFEWNFSEREKRRPPDSNRRPLG